LKPLLEGAFDIVHCLEREVCNIVFDNHHLFRKTPKVIFSNGGALPARDLPRCDFVQEYTAHNLSFSARDKAFLIPHGVDVNRFHPDVVSDLRVRHGIPHDAFVVISVGGIYSSHKRMDYVIREVAAVAGAYLLIAGQENAESAGIKALGHELMGDRVIFLTLPHEELPQAYAAANVFVLGSLFETFGIVYIEAMAMGLPVISTNHVNQRSIIMEGIFIDMARTGALTSALRDSDRSTFASLGKRGRMLAEKNYDLKVLKQQYIERYRIIAAAPVSIPSYNFQNKIKSNIRNIFKGMGRVLFGRAE
jgi:1,2-diacylglycerol 3-alpha-glucosyltransferase